MHPTGTMAQAINYNSIAPASSAAAQGSQNASSAFTSAGHRLVAKKGKASTTASPKPGTSVPETAPVAAVAKPARRRNGPQPLRLPPGKLFFGYEIKPVPKKDGEKKDGGDDGQPKFQGQGQTLRKKK